MNILNDMGVSKLSGHFYSVSGLILITKISLQNIDPGGGVGSTSRERRLVGLGVEMGGFRDQGVEMGGFRGGDG